LIKKYYIKSDNKNDKDKKFNIVLNLDKKVQKILEGRKELIENNEFFQIWKVLKPYELKLVLVLKENQDQYYIIESIAINADKEELLKMQVEFNTALKEKDIDFMHIFDKNNY
jgi:hypothetical protein